MTLPDILGCPRCQRTIRRDELACPGCGALIRVLSIKMNLFGREIVSEHVVVVDGV